MALLHSFVLMTEWYSFVCECAYVASLAFHSSVDTGCSMCWLLFNNAAVDMAVQHQNFKTAFSVIMWCSQSWSPLRGRFCEWLCSEVRGSVSCPVVSDSATPWTIAHKAPLSMGILQARKLEWVATPFSRRSSQPRIEPRFLYCRWILYHLSPQGSPNWWDVILISDYSLALRCKQKLSLGNWTVVSHLVSEKHPLFCLYSHSQYSGIMHGSPPLPPPPYLIVLQLWHQLCRTIQFEPDTVFWG